MHSLLLVGEAIGLVIIIRCHSCKRLTTHLYRLSFTRPLCVHIVNNLVFVDLCSLVAINISTINRAE